MESEREIITILEKRLFKLEKMVDKQAALILDLETKNKSLRKENALLRWENADLKERLSLNSSNSSVPSSKELYKIQKQTREPSGRKRGGQPGHKGSCRAPLAQMIYC